MPNLNTGNANTGGADKLKVFFNDTAIQRTNASTFFKQFAKMRPLEDGSHVHRETLMDRITATLDDVLAVVEGGSLKITQSFSSIDVPVVEFPLHEEITYKANKEVHFNLHKEAAYSLGKRVGVLIDQYIQRQINDATYGIPVVSAQRIYSGVGNTARADVAAGDTLQAMTLIDAVGKLANADRDMFDDGNAVGIVHTSAATSLKKENTTGGWMDISKYSNVQALYKGEIGTLYGVRIVATSNVQPYAGAGTGGIDVYPTYILSKDAYLYLEGDDITTYIKMPGANSTDNPVNGFSTVGVKARIGAKVLERDGIVIIESAAV